MARVLIVDDEANQRRLLGKQLKLNGHDVSFATNGIEGLHIANTLNPDLIILDFQMPVMSGAEMLQELRRTSYGQNIKVVMLSAATNLHVVPELDKADLILNKPVTYQDLSILVERLIQQQSSRTVAYAN